MAQVTLNIAGHAYSVACDDGQEDRIRKLGEYLDQKVGGFARTLGPVGEPRLLLLGALVIADELAEANDALRRQRVRGSMEGHDGAAHAGLTHAGLTHDSAAVDALATGIENLAARIEAVAARLEEAS